MATIQKRIGSPFFYASYREGGKWRLRSTKTTDVRQASELARAWEQASEAAGNGKLTLEAAEKLLRQTLADLANRSGTPLPTVPTMKEAVELELTAKAGSIAAVSQAKYRMIADEWLAWLGPKADLPVTDVKSIDFIEYRGMLAGKFHPETANGRLTTLATLLKPYVANGTLKVNPFDQVPRLKNTVRTRRAFTLPEIQAVLKVADEEWKGLILFGLYTGQRIGDLVDLQWKDVDLGAGELKLRQHKTGRQVCVPLHSDIVTWLNTRPAHAESNAPIFPRARSHGPSGTSHRFRDMVLAKSGLNIVGSKSPGRTRFDLSFHSLRHSAVSLIQASGASRAVAQALAGHASEAVNANYTHISSSDIRQWTNKIPSVLLSEQPPQPGS